MKLLREKLLLTWKRILRLYANYRVTVSAVALLSVYGTVHCFLYIFDYKERVRLPIWSCFEYAKEIYAAMLLYICSAMFTESWLPYLRKERRIEIIRFVCFLVAALVAVLVGFGMSIDNSAQVFHVTGSQVRGWTGQFAWGYALLLLLGTVYFCHRKSGVGFIEYMLHVLVNWCKATVVYVVLYCGVAIVFSVVDTLFFDSWGMLAESGTILVTGLYYVPCCIMSLCNMESDIDNTPGKFLIRDVLTGITICALAIVYAYLFKILFLWEMPSNEIFGIVAGLFCFGMPICVMAGHYRDGTRYMCFLQKIPYGLIPLLPVQLYAMGVRIYEHGMTPSRYLGMIMVSVEIVALLIWHFYREKMERLLLFLGVCVIVAFFMPGINKNSLSDRWQLAFLKTYHQKLLTQGSLTQIERGRLWGAYHYLEHNPEMTAVLEQYDIYEESFASKLAETGMDMDAYTKVEEHYIHCCQMVGSLDVGGYSSFDMLNQDTGYKGTAETGLPVDFSAFRFYRRENGTEEIVIADLSDFARRCMSYEKEHPDADEEEFTTAMKPYQKITLDDGSVLYLNHFKVRYQDGIKDGEAHFEIKSVDISGMLLER